MVHKRHFKNGEITITTFALFSGVSVVLLPVFFADPEEHRPPWQPFVCYEWNTTGQCPVNTGSDIPEMLTFR
eukprot:10905538-Prorocentrum_lima.AAC.1